MQNKQVLRVKKHPCLSFRLVLAHIEPVERAVPLALGQYPELTRRLL
ncbi:MAG TPA: hypothetical protein VGE04_08280 [Chloroflexia bacterium]|jgi:hypothetical protein